MSILIPALSTCERRMTGGERRFAERLEKKLEDDYLCWYDVPVGARQLHPDFVILNPRRGLLVLEVKDWKLDTIQSIDRNSATLLTARGLVQAANPMEQARQYAHAVCRVLEGDPALICPPGHPHAGQLACPWGYGVVLTNISRKQFDATDLGEVLEPDRVICQDEMFESVDPLVFQGRLWRMFKHRFAHLLSMPQVDRIRWHLFPEVRIGAGQASLLLDVEPAESIAAPDLIRVLDLQQEQLARSIGDGHRVIHGVAGSGKTLILVYRCLHLSKMMRKPILLLCFSAPLAARIASLVEDKGLGENVVVRNFHRWCADQMQLYQVAPPEPGADYFDRLVDAVIRGAERGLIPSAQYGAVLIDEGHDFRAEWLKLAVRMVDPETNSLLLLYDDAQAIFERPAGTKFSFSSAGIQARGRTTILKLNYRNTAEILALAQEFAKDVLVGKEDDEDSVPLIPPETAGRHGPRPQIIRLPRFTAEADYLVERFRELHDQGHAWNQMAVVYRTRFMGEKVTERLRAAQLPVTWINEQKAKRRFDPKEDSIKVVTMHSSKGLEFPIVGIPGLGYMPHAQESPQHEARLLYVAMTRAVDSLILTTHRDTAFTMRLDAAYARVFGQARVA